MRRNILIAMSVFSMFIGGSAFASDVDCNGKDSCHNTITNDSSVKATTGPVTSSSSSTGGNATTGTISNTNSAQGGMGGTATIQNGAVKVDNDVTTSVGNASLGGTSFSPKAEGGDAVQGQHQGQVGIVKSDNDVVNKNTDINYVDGAEQGQKQGQDQVGIVKDGDVTIDGDSYEINAEPNFPVASAAALPSAFCGGSGMSAQFQNWGASVTSTNYVCMRLALAAALNEQAERVQAIRTAIAVENTGKGKTSKSTAVADDKMAALVGQLKVDARHQIDLASKRLDEDDTVVRRFFVRTLGSLPVLHFLAPR